MVTYTSKNIFCKINGIWKSTIPPLPKIYAVDIAVNNSDPYKRVTYPQTVTIGGQVYDNACYGYTPGNGTDIGSWAQDYDSGTGLISGIVPGMLNSSTRQFTPSSTHTQIPNGYSNSSDPMTYVPTWYQWWNNDGETIRIICCQEQLTSDFKDYAGSIGTDRKGHFYLGCYTCNYLYRSDTGAPYTNETYQDYLTGCQSRGTNYDMITWFQWCYLAMLCVFIWKSTDLQNAFAGGYCGSSHASKISNESIETTQYGMAGIPGDFDNRMAFFWIEDLWGNIFQLLGGAHLEGDNLVFNTGRSSTSSWDLQTNMTIGPMGISDASIIKIAGGTDTMFYPLEFSTTSNIYFADSGGFGNPNVYPVAGGGWASGSIAGPFCIYFTCAKTNSSKFNGTRLSYRG